MENSLAFNEVQLTPISHDNNIWIRSSELARALDYSDERRISILYNRHSDEFSNDMSVVLNLSEGKTPAMTRVFSLRGCHLLAMFARTQVAKAFRVWVLDVLETLNKEAPQPALPSMSRLSHRSDPERKELTAMINAWVSCAPLHYAGARAIVNAHFGVKSVDELTVEQVKEAIRYVQVKIGEGQTALPAPAQPSVEDQLEAHFLKIRTLCNSVADEERAIYEIIKENRHGVMNTFDDRRSAYIHAGMTIDNLFYSIDYGLKAAEANAKVMCRMYIM